MAKYQTAGTVAKNELGMVSTGSGVDLASIGGNH